MADKPYVDFDLLIDRSNNKYRVRVINSPDGPASNEFVLPFSDDKLENFILRISQGRRNIRSGRMVEADTSREFGAALFQTIFDGEVDVCLRNSITNVELSGSGLRIRLRLSDTPELVDIPWEYLYDPTRRRFLALSVDTPLVRYLDLPGRVKPLAVQPPLNVLVMIASPSDDLQLDVKQEWLRLKSAVVDLEQQGQLHLDRLEKATLDELQKRLRRQEYHVFHFIGHGSFDPKTNDGVLMLEDESGRGKAIPGHMLGTLLHDEKTLRLALLNACEGGRTSKTDPFAGVGQSLLQQGIPAVIAMQFEVTDDTAITLAHSFYAALADGYPVDAALTEARKTIFARNAVEWGTPVLYMRAPDGRIFDVAGLEPTVKAKNQVGALLAAAQTAMVSKEWEKAADLFNQVIALDPTNGTAAAELASVHRSRSELDLSIVIPAEPLSPAEQRSPTRLLFGVGALLAVLISWLAIRSDLSGWFENSTVPLVPNLSEEQHTAQGTAANSLPQTCRGISDPPLAVGVQGRVCTKSETLSLRSLPSKNSDNIKRLAPGTSFRVVGEAQCGDYNGQQYRWWRVDAEGSTGWLADAQDNVDPVFLCRADTATSAETATASFQGEWNTNFAVLTIHQTNSTVAGKYLQYGQSAVKEFTGTVVGRKLSAVNTSGTEINFTLNKAGDGFEGLWRNTRLNLAGDWCGVRKGQTLPAGCGFSGRWQTNHQVGGWIELIQTGETVNGEFYNGATLGTVTGRMGVADRGAEPAYSVYGSYQEPSSSGAFRFDLLSFNSIQFQGCWQNSNSQRGDWCGWRADEQRPESCRPTTPTCP